MRTVKRRMHVTKDGIYLEMVSAKQLNELRKLAQKDALQKVQYKLMALPEIIDKRDAINAVAELMMTLLKQKDHPLR